MLLLKTLVKLVCCEQEMLLLKLVCCEQLAAANPVTQSGDFSFVQRLLAQTFDKNFKFSPQKQDCCSLRSTNAALVNCDQTYLEHICIFKNSFLPNKLFTSHYWAVMSKTRSLLDKEKYATMYNVLDKKMFDKMFAEDV